MYLQDIMCGSFIHDFQSACKIPLLLLEFLSASFISKNKVSRWPTWFPLCLSFVHQRTSLQDKTNPVKEIRAENDLTPITTANSKGKLTTFFILLPAKTISPTWQMRGVNPMDSCKTKRRNFSAFANWLMDAWNDEWTQSDGWMDRQTN